GVGARARVPKRLLRESSDGSNGRVLRRRRNGLGALPRPRAAGPAHSVDRVPARNVARRRRAGREGARVVSESELDAELERKREIAKAVLGWPGRMIAWSKSTYARENPAGVYAFNASVAVTDGEVWSGDLSITDSEQLIQELADQLGERVFAL